jgi:hypothetical protein
LRLKNTGEPRSGTPPGAIEAAKEAGDDIAVPQTGWQFYRFFVLTSWVQPERTEKQQDSVEQPPMKLDELIVWRDGGSLGFKMSDASGRQIAFCVDGRASSPTCNHFFLNVPHPAQQGGRKLDLGGDEEKQLISYLQSWLDGNFTQAQRTALLQQDKDVDKLTKPEFNTWHILRLIENRPKVIRHMQEEAQNERSREIPPAINRQFKPEAGKDYAIVGEWLFRNPRSDWPGPALPKASRAWSLANEFVYRTALADEYVLPAHGTRPAGNDVYRVTFAGKHGGEELMVEVESRAAQGGEPARIERVRIVRQDDRQESRNRPRAAVKQTNDAPLGRATLGVIFVLFEVLPNFDPSERLANRVLQGRASPALQNRKLVRRPPAQGSMRTLVIVIFPPSVDLLLSIA